MSRTSRDVTIEDAPDKVIRRSIVVDAPASQIFDLLADPARHRDFDGSDTVRRSTEETPERLSLGAKFAMRMKMVVPYRMSNEVVEFVENERIAWTHVGGHVWRYTLAPVDDRTQIVEEFDWRSSWAGPGLEIARVPARNAKAIDATLARLANLVEQE